MCVNTYFGVCSDVGKALFAVGRKSTRFLSESEGIVIY